MASIILQRFPFGNDVLAVCIPVDDDASSSPKQQQHESVACPKAPRRRRPTAYELRKAAQGAPWLALVAYSPQHGATAAEAAAHALVRPRAADMR